MTMIRTKTVVLVAALFLIAAAGPSASQDKPADKPAAPAAPAAPRPIALLDILAWKSIGATELSPDGSWFMYRLSPLEGESEIVIREVRGTKEHRFPIGEAPRFGGSLRTGFSADSKWAAFLAYPGAKEAKAMRKERKRVMTTAVLVDLAKGEKTEFEKVRAAAFSGDDPGFLALHRYAPESQEKEKDKWTGSDLVVRTLATGNEVNMGNVAEFAFDKSGKRLALVIDAQGMAANGLQLRDMASGAVVSLENDKASYKSLVWTEKGEALALLKGKEDKAYEDKLWSVVGFTGFGGPKGPQKVVFDPTGDKSFPEGMTVSPNRAPAWTESFDAILFGIHEAKKKKDADKKDAPGAPPAAARGTGRRGRRRRSGPRHLARPGQPSPIAAAGPGADGQELQLSRRIPRRREDVHPPGRRRSPGCLPGAQAAVRRGRGRPGLRARREPRRTALRGHHRRRHEDREADPGPVQVPLHVLGALRRQSLPLLRRRPFLHLRHDDGPVRQHHQGRPRLVRQRGQRHQRRQAAGLPRRLDQGRPERPALGRLGHLERAR